MKVSSLGEDAVVAALTRGLPCGEDVRLGAGDDCAVIGGARDRMWQLLKTDCVVEGVHFLAAEKPARIGWKAMCRAVSDIAAMGGGPRHALITIAVACDVKMAWLRGIYAGLRAAARRFGVSIVGGETSRSPGPAFISIALTGEVERTRCVTRGGGKAGAAQSKDPARSGVTSHEIARGPSTPFRSLNSLHSAQDDSRFWNG